jgi:uncharacterized membrane protein YbhN (UPF0104 family)
VWLLKLLCSAALLWYIASRISLGGLGAALAGADPALVGLGLALSAAGMAAAAHQLRVVGEQQEISLSTRDALALNLATSFYNLFLPGIVAGGVARWYRLARSHSADQPMAALAVILGSRFAELVTVLIAGLLFWAADPLARSRPLVPAVFGGLLVGLALGLRVATYRRRPSPDQAPSRSSSGAPLPSAWRSRLEAAGDAAARFRKMPARTLRRLAAASAARHLLMIGSFYCFALALHLPLTLAIAGWTRTVVVLAGMLPVTLGGLGVREGSLIAVLHAYGIPPHEAAALGLLLFGREALAGAVGAIIETRWFLSPGEAASRTRW